MSFRAPVPKPQTSRPGFLRLLAILTDNPLEAWTAEHFEKPLVHDRLPFMPAVVVSDPSAVQRILLDNAQNYRKDKLLHRILSPTLSNGLLLVDGEQWRKQRRAVAPMFARKSVASYAAAMKDAADAVVGRWLRNPDESIVDVAQEAAEATLDVLQRTIFSQGIGRSTRDFRLHMRRYFDAIGRLDPCDVLALPAFLPRWTKWRARDSMRFFDAAVDAVIRQRRTLASQQDDERLNDILNLLLEARDPETGEGLNEEELRANIVTLIAAGHETTANALTWSLFLLSQDKVWQDRVAAEAQRTVAGAAEWDPDGLASTRAVVEEALRLYPPIAAISRVAIAADELSGQPIRAGTMTIVAPYVIHRHRRLWERPDAFDPNRFLGENRMRVNRYAYLPFGAGPRICLGASFALQEATILLASIAAHFSFEMAPGTEIEPLLRITLRPRNGLPMVLTRRPTANFRATVCRPARGQRQRIPMAS
ncbi:MAG TPA: cytochrome P450 [Rhizomicrobium sp.]|jgi:cytochrome P450|nr:cytochrome P450 [Rhizomicrobium sp.]